MALETTHTEGISKGKWKSNESDNVPPHQKKPDLLPLSSVKIPTAYSLLAQRQHNTLHISSSSRHHHASAEAEEEKTNNKSNSNTTRCPPPPLLFPPNGNGKSPPTATARPEEGGLRVARAFPQCQNVTKMRRLSCPRAGPREGRGAEWNGMEWNSYGRGKRSAMGEGE